MEYEVRVAYWTKVEARSVEDARRKAVLLHTGPRPEILEVEHIHDWLSGCCGAGWVDEADQFCASCRDQANFECECGAERV